MPAEYTHQIAAEQIYAALPADVRGQIADFPAYSLGAQGGDVFYFLRLFCAPRYNLGKFLHNRGVYEVFSAFLDAAKGAGPAAVSYIAGYVTHYAVDTTFHPFVYGRSAQLRQSDPKARCRWHSYIESDIDSYIIHRTKGIPVGAYRFPIRYQAADAAQIAPVLNAVCRAVGQKKVTPRLFRRAARRYEWFERAFYDRRGRRRRFLTGFERVFRVPRFFSTFCRREKVDAWCSNADGAVWSNPAQPSFVSFESAEALFERSVAEGVRLLCLFFDCLQRGGPLPRADFGKGFLTGVGCEPLTARRQ